jgi:hypothetical protein
MSCGWTAVIGHYVGHVDRRDQLHGYLSWLAADQLGVRQPQHDFRAFRLNGSNVVYGYEETNSGAKMICKFYEPRFGWDRDRAAWTAHNEFDSLHRLRGYSLVGSPHHVIRPLGVNRDINCLLALEYYGGEPFSDAIRAATHGGNDAHLYWRLKALAYFLSTLHNRTANGHTVDFGTDLRYLDAVVGRLARRGRLGDWDCDELRWLRDRWAENPAMWQDREVWLHGDATPANFLFGEGMDVAAIDLERTRRGDRMVDVGRVAGELQHAFMQATGDRRRAEPFIGHFLWEYSCHFPDRGSAFASITSRLPYYMGLNLLRIARNDYIDHDYSRRLVQQAKSLLRAF